MICHKFWYKKTVIPKKIVIPVRNLKSWTFLFSQVTSKLFHTSSRDKSSPDSISTGEGKYYEYTQQIPSLLRRICENILYSLHLSCPRYVRSSVTWRQVDVRLQVTWRSWRSCVKYKLLGLPDSFQILCIVLLASVRKQGMSRISLSWFFYPNIPIVTLRNPAAGKAT